jgi:cell division protein FtsL
MTNGSSSFDRRFLWILTVCAILFGAAAAFEARIDYSVRNEMQERKDADTRIEERLDKNMSDIRQELRELNSYLRETR